MRPDEFVRRTGLSFSDPCLLRRALTHRSYINEHPEELEDNERLEYLGDAALDFIAAFWLYNRFPEMDEGALTRLRSALVRTEQLAAFASELGLGEVIFLGKGESATGGRQRPALLCATFEALIGALYLDAGIETVVNFIEPRFERAAKAVLEDERLVDARSILQMWSQSELGEIPNYRTVGTFGPDHDREFAVEVSIGERVKADGRGRSKQEASQAAAVNALQKLGLNNSKISQRLDT
ncbi:MAG TPA: ribonuclease III [Anaerolineales bacterium]|nr:ribonuclease III [Anaerolineales bacterium]